MARSASFLLVFAICLATSACASRPAAPPGPEAALQSRLAVGASLIPLQGLPAIPRLVAGEASMELVNFGEEREEKRQRRLAGGAGGGALQGAAVSLGVAPLCVLFPPACVGLLVVGAASGAAAADVTSVTAEQAEALSRVIIAEVNHQALVSHAALGLPAPAEAEYPVVVLQVAAVVLVPAKQGVEFRIVGKARAAPAPERQWDESFHVVTLPARSPEKWLAGGLPSELRFALQRLGNDMVNPYIPYEQRVR